MEHHTRVLLDLTQVGLENELPQLLSMCEEVWWLVETRYADTSWENLRKLLAAEPRLAGRPRVIWIMGANERFAPPLPNDARVSRPDFKVVLDEPRQATSRQHEQGIGRLVRHLQGVRIGLALGGGGARGLAHLGVLRRLESAGLSFDMLAGTSSGALMGAAYAGGFSPQEAVEAFREALTPPRLMQSIPGGNRIYIWTMFRIGAWDRMLRQFFGDATLEQLQLPLATVAVDLVSGKQVIRDRGDAVRAVVESINVPMISRPILADGMALVDGGVLNNLPADVLADAGRRSSSASTWQPACQPATAGMNRERQPIGCAERARWRRCSG